MRSCDTPNDIIRLQQLLGRTKARRSSKKVLWSFDVDEGYEPYDALIANPSGNLYGTTYSVERMMPARWLN